jgi:hypothetical protein
MNLWYSERGAWHKNILSANTTQAFRGTDSEGEFKRNCNTAHTRSLLEHYKWIDADISYSYNYQGFRSEEFDDRPCGLAFGCSFTEGIGLPLEAAWPSVLSEKLNLKVWNLGQGGAALDTVFRLLDHYVDVFDPKFVAVFMPPENRYEYHDRFGEYRTVLPSSLDLERYKDFAKEWFVNPANAEQNTRRNILAMKHRCYQRGITMFVFDSQTQIRFDKAARDLQHPGRLAMQDFANTAYNTIIESGITL